MIYREIEYLSKSVECKSFIERYNLKIQVDQNQKLYLLSKCYVFEIYGFIVEDFFYFDIHSMDLKYSSSLNRLLSDYDSNILLPVYEREVAKRQQILIPKLQMSELQSNRELTLKAEQYFFTMLCLMDELLSEVLICERNIKQEHWSSISEHKMNELKRVLYGD